MNFRKHAEPRVLGFMIAPIVDILLVILVFFIVTWNFALSENELDVNFCGAALGRHEVLAATVSPSVWVCTAWRRAPTKGR